MIKQVIRSLRRQLANKIAYLLLGILFALLPALVGGLQASAASGFDDNYNLTDELKIGDINYYGINCDIVDHTFDWAGIILDKNNYANPAHNYIADDYLVALDQGRWAVSQSIQRGSVDSQKHYVINVMFTTNNSAYLQWQTDEIHMFGSPTNTLFKLEIMTEKSLTGSGTCKPIVRKVSAVQLSTKITSAGFGVWNYLTYVDEENINYPAGYEGTPIRETGVEPPVLSDEVPDFYASTSLDFQVNLHDQNFNTIDPSPWLCSADGNTLVPGDDNNGLAPVLHWQIWDDINGYNTDLKSSGVQSATAPIMWKAPKSTTDKEYRIAGWYECGGAVDFTDAGNKTFVITKHGSLGNQDLMQDCFKENFPFIDMGACVSNLATVFNMFTFGIFSLNNTWASAGDCHNLVILGHWIFSPGVRLCPQVPAYVRDVVTPFFTMILGFITIRFIAEGTGSKL